MKAKIQELECLNPPCRVKFQVLVPVPQIINTPIMEQVVILHPDSQPCPNCGTHYQMKLTGVQGFALHWEPVAPPPDDRLVDLAADVSPDTLRRIKDGE